MDDLYKLCPECAGEYRMEIERCADCGVPLVSPEEIARRKWRELPASGLLRALRTAPILWARALADDLAAQGIPYGVDRSRARSEGLLTLRVRRRDWDAAQEVDAARQRIEGPRYAEEEDPIAAEEPNVLDFPEPPSYKVCPRCGGEYRLDIEVCADCGDRLVLPERAPEEVSRRAPRQEPGPDDDSLYYDLLPPGDDLVCICCRSLGELEILKRKLDELGIAHRVDPGPAVPSTRFACLYVLPADGDAAGQVDADCFGGTPLEEADLAELAICPACGTPCGPDSLECSGCGLSLGADPATLDLPCGHCGAVVYSGAGARCPNCGSRLPAS